MIELIIKLIITNKPVNQITASDVNLFISLSFEVEAMKKEFDTTAEQLSKIFENDELKNSSLREIHEAAWFKIITCDEMARSKSTLESSKQRHTNNINILNVIKN